MAVNRSINIELLKTQQVLQRYMFDNHTQRIGFGGARKGGKSYGGRVMMVLRRLMYPGTVGIILRQTREDVALNHKEQIISFLKYTLKMKEGRDFGYTEKDYTFTFHKATKNGIPSKIVLGFAKSVKDADKYRGIVYMDVWFDEAQDFMKEIVDLLWGSLQNDMYVGACPKLLITCNPGGVGHKWIRELFIYENTRLSNTVWIPSLLKDNTYMMRTDPGFAKRMTEQYKDHPVLLEQWLNGNWEIAESNYFHLALSNICKKNIPYYAKIWAGLDWGYYPTAFACVWFATWRDSYGKRYCHVFAETRQLRLDMDKQAELVLKIEEGLELRGVTRFADPATRKRIESESMATSRSIADVWSKHGLRTTPSKKIMKVVGLRIIDQLLIRGILTIDPSCVNLIQEIRDAQYHKNADGTFKDITDARQDDDMTDALRYGLLKIYDASWSVELKNAWVDTPRKQESIASV